MNKGATLLGCATENLAVVFDLCYDLYGSRSFHIFKNIPVNSSLDMPVKKPKYSITVHEPEEPFQKKGPHLFFGVPGPYAKKKVYGHFNKKWEIGKQDFDSLIHPAAVMAPSILWQPGIMIEPGVVISSQTVLGFGVTIKRRVTIGHHCVIGDYVEINPGVTISGHVVVQPGTIIGSGAVIRNGITIGENSVIGMGSLVLKDIPPGVVAYGNPCRVVRENSPRN